MYTEKRAHHTGTAASVAACVCTQTEKQTVPSPPAAALLALSRHVSPPQRNLHLPSYSVGAVCLTLHVTCTGLLVSDFCCLAQWL